MEIIIIRQQEKVMAEFVFLRSSPSYLFIFSKIHLAPKISNYNWKLTKYENEVYL